MQDPCGSTPHETWCPLYTTTNKPTTTNQPTSEIINAVKGLKLNGASMKFIVRLISVVTMIAVLLGKIDDKNKVTFATRLATGFLAVATMAGFQLASPEKILSEVRKAVGSTFK